MSYTVYGCCMDASLAVVAGDGATPNIPVAIGTVAESELARNLPACVDATDSDLHHVYWTSESSTPAGAPAYYPDHRVFKVIVEKNETTGVLAVSTAAAVIARKVKAVSRPFGADTVVGPYILVQHQAEVQAGNEFYSQSSYFLLDADGRVVGKSSVGRAGPWSELTDYLSSHYSFIGGHYSNTLTSGYEHTISALRLVSQNSDAGEYLNVPSLCESSYQKLVVTEGEPGSLRCLERGNLHIPNSNPYIWDGQSLVEDGFLVYPEGLSVAISDGGGKLVNGATYQWCATYEWMDANGFTHSSAPSPPLEATISAVGDDGLAAIYVPYLSLTRKANVRVVLWRTKAKGQIFYRVSAVDNSLLSSQALFGDAGGSAAADDDLVGAPYLYTTGGRYENIQPQPYRTHAIHQDRHFIVDRERESTHVWYSKSGVSEDDNEERGFQANDRMLVQVPPDGGRIIALSSYLDRLLIFKETRIYVVTGAGVDDSGQGAGYANAVLLDPAIGCTNEKSVVQIPTGVMFLSKRGIYQLDQSLQRQPVGLPVRDHTDLGVGEGLDYKRIVAANVIPAKGYVVFSTGGDALVYSYIHGVWSTFSNHEATDAIEWNGWLWWKAPYLSGDYVKIENTSSFLDVAKRFAMTLRTGVMSFSGLFAFERIYSVGFLGQAIAACVFRVKTAYDAAPAWLDNQAINGVTALGKYFDVASYLGTMSDTSFLDKTLMIDAGTSRQKCGAVQTEISDEQIPAVVTIVTVANATAYRVDIAPGASSASQIIYTSDGTATRAEIVNGLVVLINVWSAACSNPVLASNVGDTLSIAATGNTATFAVTLAGGETKMTVANGSPTNDAGYSISLLAFEIGLLPGAWPSSVIGTARGM